MTADESPDDFTVYDLAEQVVAGMPRTDAAHREIAAELLRVRTEVQEIVRTVADIDIWEVRMLARSMGIEGA